MPEVIRFENLIAAGGKLPINTCGAVTWRINDAPLAVAVCDRDPAISRLPSMCGHSPSCRGSKSPQTGPALLVKPAEAICRREVQKPAGFRPVTTPISMPKRRQRTFVGFAQRQHQPITPPAERMADKQVTARCGWTGSGFRSTQRA